MVNISKSQSIATVERAGDVLLLFSQSNEKDLGITEIARKLGLSKAAVHRILASLRSRGFIELVEESRRYTLGSSSLALGFKYLTQIDIRTLAAPELASISRITHETATLSIRNGMERFYIDQVVPNREIVMSVPIGITYPLHAGSSSKVFLAWLAEPEVTHYLKGKLKVFTPTTPKDSSSILKELSQIRNRGFALSVSERQAGAASVAAPVFDVNGNPIAVISICGPAERITPTLTKYVPQLLDSASRLSKRMGYNSRKGSVSG